MSTLNQVELQNLRHFIGAQENSYAKLTHYADSAVDPQIKQILRYEVIILSLVPIVIRNLVGYRNNIYSYAIYN